MITARTTRLLRVPDLQAFQRAIVAAVPSDPSAARQCAVIVPSRSAAEELRRTIEIAVLEKGVRVMPLPDFVTRDDLYVRIRERLDGAPPLLTPFDREVLFRRAARHASEAGFEPPFHLRARLIVEVLALYDEMRRRDRTVRRFGEFATEELAKSADFDRGAERMLRQTRFLIAAFENFERAVSDTGQLDEHLLRALALQSAHPVYAQAIVTVGDQAADRRGLWAVDFDLLARLPGLSRIEVIATEALLASGFHERIHDRLPGIEDVRAGESSALPILVVPEAKEPGGDAPRAFVCRDREEELAEVARLVKTDARRTTALGRTAVVFQRPLPYLYLAHQVFADARVPYQALDALPLAAEPFAAAVDLVFACIAGSFTRTVLVELMRSPHFAFTDAGQRISQRDVAGLDRFLADRKHLGGADRLAELAARLSSDAGAAVDDRRRATLTGVAPALRAAAALAAELNAIDALHAASAQISAVLRFIASHECGPRFHDPWYPRHMRARGAVFAAMDMLRRAHATHDDERLSIAELSGTVRRWIEGQTFTPRAGTGGLNLLDARAAAYADLDELRVVGLTDGDWPERSARNIFYPPGMLAQMGWPSDQERLSAERARFQDLLRLPRRRVSLSTFTLENDELAAPSPFLEDIDAAGLPMERRTPGPVSRIFTHEALAFDPVVPSALTSPAREWLATRLDRAAADQERFHGTTGARAPGVYAVSHVERYLDCPFKYFAGYVLRLPEERAEESWLSPQERGQFMHQVFCDFFTEWHGRGGGAVSSLNVIPAMELFEKVAEARLETLPDGDQALERTLLLGSAVAPGLAERAFAFEIEQGIPVVERLLEYELQGIFTFGSGESARPIEIRSKADRIDLLEDGTLRIVDYKLGKAPKWERALQLPVYGVSAEQALDGRHDRSWAVSHAGYVAFREKLAFVSLAKKGSDITAALAEGQQRLLGAIDGIERGEFPPRPAEPFLCSYCAYPSVCRKDYVGDE